MPRQYPPAVRQELVDRMLAGESVLSLVTEYGVPEQTLHRWNSQARVYAGLTDGVALVQSYALRDAHRRIDLPPFCAPVSLQVLGWCSDLV